MSEPRPVSEDDRGNWTATMRVTVTKVVQLTDCTRAQAEDEPWEFSTGEREVDQIDWEIVKLEKDHD